MTDTPKHSVSVAGIVVDRHGRVLAIQRRDNAQWEPPGGVLEVDESPEAGVRREVLEETRIRVEVDTLSGLYKNMKKAIVAIVFRCRPIGGHEQESDESQNVKWLTPDEVNKCMDEAFAIRVRDALKEGSSVRIHDGIHLL